MKLTTIVIVWILVLMMNAFAQGPAWWFERDVVDTNLTANDYALINQGQLKWVATNAYAEMEENFDAGTNLAALVGGFSNPTNSNANYCLANLGQVKYVVQPFYDRLYALNLTNTLPANLPGYYPWGNAPETNDYALANLGQVKYVFSFDSSVDTDDDGLTDWQEAGYGTSPYHPDTDGDGLPDGDEVERGTDPNNPDTDGDGLSDGWEVGHGKDPQDPHDAEPDLTNLRETARQRIIRHWQLYYGTAPVFTNIPGSPADLNDMKNALNALSGKFYKVE